jgi:hypothetical protein
MRRSSAVAGNSGGPPIDAKSQKAARLALALRQNLRRRKVQSTERKDVSESSPSADDAPLSKDLVPKADTTESETS